MVMKILCHGYRNNVWNIKIKHEEIYYFLEIEANKSTTTDDYYYIGYLKSKIFDAEYIHFGFSNYMNNVSYILKAVKRVIMGDTSSIQNTYCTLTPKDFETTIKK